MQRSLANVIYVASKVVKGYGRGSKELGIPTANLEDHVVPNITLDDGIYYGFAQLDYSPNLPLNIVQLDQQASQHQQKQNHQLGQQQQQKENKDKKNESMVMLEGCPHNPIYPMVCSLGWNPQYNNKSRTLEVHILHHFDYDFYGSVIRIAICGYIRPEMRFESLQKLIDTIHEDIRFAQNVLDQPMNHWLHVVTNQFFHL